MIDLDLDVRESINEATRLTLEAMDAFYAPFLDAAIDGMIDSGNLEGE